MDPITCAAKRFLSEMDELREAEHGPVVRIIVEDADRGELVKALRLGEAAPENRRPLFLIQAAFFEPQSYFNDLCEKIAADYERIRQGAAEEGVALAPFYAEEKATSRPLPPIQRAALAIECVTTLLRERLDGVLVALVPAHIQAPAQWQNSVATLAKVSFSPGVCIAVSDPLDGPLERTLNAGSVRFTIDRDKLRAYTRKLVLRTASAPSTIDEGRELTLLLLDASDQMNQGEPSESATTYRRAIAICQANNRAGEEACVWIALAAALVAQGNTSAAQESYQKAAEAAERADLPLLRAEALRMTHVGTLIPGSRQEREGLCL